MSRAEGIKKFTILPVELSEDNGYLSAKQSVKRHLVGKGFAADIDGTLCRLTAPRWTDSVPTDRVAVDGSRLGLCEMNKALSRRSIGNSDDEKPDGNSYVAKGEAFDRDTNYIEDRILADPDSQWPVEPGRYRLIAARACPWANRTIIVRRLLGLEDVISIGMPGPTHDARSWTFDLDPGGVDPVLGIERLQQAVPSPGSRTTRAESRFLPWLTSPAASG